MVACEMTNFSNEEPKK